MPPPSGCGSPSGGPSNASSPTGSITLAMDSETLTAHQYQPRRTEALRRRWAAERRFEGGHGSDLARRGRRGGVLGDDRGRDLRAAQRVVDRTEEQHGGEHRPQDRDLVEEGD